MFLLLQILLLLSLLLLLLLLLPSSLLLLLLLMMMMITLLLFFNPFLDTYFGAPLVFIAGAIVATVAYNFDDFNADVGVFATVLLLMLYFIAKSKLGVSLSILYLSFR